jgi:FkbM family methyltransferase
MTDVIESTSGSAVALSNLELRHKLMKLIGKQPTFAPVSGELAAVDVIVTCCEVSDRHGTGVLVQRIFSDDANIFALRGVNYYGGDQDFGRAQACLNVGDLSRAHVFAAVLSTLENCQPQRVVCIPFQNEDVRLAIATQALFGIPLCTYLMDDPNVHANYVSDELMQELLEKSTLRLAISPEMKQAYEGKYRLKFWTLPPVVTSELIRPQAYQSAAVDLAAKRGILVGNVWGQDWLDRLRQTVRGTGIVIDWYCNNADQCSWLNFDRAELAEDGITLYAALPEPELAQVLQSYAFALLPSGTLAADDSKKSIAALSLPSRIPFLLASSQMPVIVLGSAETASARFVRRFELGAVVNYVASEFQAAVARICTPAQQTQMRENAAKLAPIFDCQGVSDWLWQSLAQGEAIDDRYEQLLPPLPGDLSYFVDRPARADVYRDMLPTFQGLERIQKYLGFNPDFVIDVGASTGIWSHNMAKIFPSARFILLDPLFSKYDQASRDYHIGNHANFETVEVAIAEAKGELEFKVSLDLYNSSLFSVGQYAPSELVKVKVRTLDDIASEKRIQGRGLLKIDVQFAEHLVLAGATQLIEQVDAVILELTLTRDHPKAKTFIEMMELMDQLGFRYFDDIGDWRDPQTGVLRQKDGLFVRKHF